MMRKIGYNLLFMVGLMMSLGMFSAVSANTFSVVSTD